MGQDLDLFVNILVQAMGQGCLIVWIYVVDIEIIRHNPVIGGSSGRVVRTHEMAVSASFHGILAVLHRSLSQIFREPFCS